MARLSGKDGAASVGGIALLLESWEFEYKGESVQVRAGGDVGTHREPTFKDWSATINALITTGSYPNIFGLLNTSVAMVLKHVGGNTGLISATGLLQSIKPSNTVDNEPVKLTLEVVMNDAVNLPTFTVASP